MTRNIPPSLAPVLEQLELNNDELVTMARLDELVRTTGLETPTRIVAARLRQRGWLLDTGRRGVWEFAPAAVAGPYSRHSPTRLLRSLLARREVRCGLTFHAAAWAMGAANRAPQRIEVAVADQRDVRWMPKPLDVSVFEPNLSYRIAKGVPTLEPESVLTHMAAAPNRVRLWSSAVEWLPDIAAEADVNRTLIELHGRPATVSARFGYLLQGLRPDVVNEISRPKTKTWFGPRRSLVRHDAYWQIADTILPFDPRDLKPAG